MIGQTCSARRPDAPPEGRGTGFSFAAGELFATIHRRVGGLRGRALQFLPLPSPPPAAYIFRYTAEETCQQ